MPQHFILKPGDTIGVCAPSSCFDENKLSKGIAVIKNMGFDVRVPDLIFDSKRYLAGDDLTRARVFNELVSDPDVNAIISARGGFGSMRMLEFVDWDLLAINPKPLIGFSDVTALLLNIIERVHLPVIHGPNLTCLAEAVYKTTASLKETLTTKNLKMEILNPSVVHPGICKGILKGGNLATISHLIGTAFQPDFKQAVLFLEDINEPAYKIDRMLAQMKMAGLFNEICGVVTGSFDRCDNVSFIPEIMVEMFDEYQIPVLSGLDSGHGKVNLSLRMGVEVTLDTESSTLAWNV